MTLRHAILSLFKEYRGILSKEEEMILLMKRRICEGHYGLTGKVSLIGDHDGTEFYNTFKRIIEDRIKSNLKKS